MVEARYAVLYDEDVEREKEGSEINDAPEQSIDFNLDFNDDILHSSNVAHQLNENERAWITNECLQGYRADMDSESDWRYRVDLIRNMIKIEPPDNPEYADETSNVKLPVIVKAVAQYYSRAVPSLIKNQKAFHFKVNGRQEPEKIDRAQRLTDYHNYQLFEVMDNWEENTRHFVMQDVLIGCSYKKVWWYPLDNKPISKFIAPEDISFNYYTPFAECDRHTTWYDLSYNQILERQRRGQWIKCDLSVYADSNVMANDEISEGDEEERQAKFGDAYAKHRILEQYCWFDLDGDDYREPYIAFIHKPSGKLLCLEPRIRRVDLNEDREIIRIVPSKHFVEAEFIPAPDGSSRGWGIGMLLLASNDVMNTIVNQLVDAASWQNEPSWLYDVDLTIGNRRNERMELNRGEGTGVKVPHGSNKTLNNSVMWHVHPGPSQVLFQLLGVFMEESEKLISINEIMMGQSPGANVPATTVMAMIEQGQMIFSATFRALLKAIRDEFRIIFRLNAENLGPVAIEDAQYYDQGDSFFYSDFDDDGIMDVSPISDESALTDTQRIMKAQAAIQAVPGSLAAIRNYLLTIGVENVDEIIDELSNPQPDPKVVAEMEKLNIEKERIGLESRKLDMEEMRLRLDITKGQTDNDKIKADMLHRLVDAEKIRSETQKNLSEIGDNDIIDKQQDKIRELEETMQAIERNNAQYETLLKLMVERNKEKKDNAETTDKE